MLGCVLRDIERKCVNPEGRLAKVLNLAKAIFSQKRDDKNKVYSVHAPEVECIAKGKVHKKYEFGCVIRSKCHGTCGRVFQAIGVAIPPAIREVA